MSKKVILTIFVGIQFLLQPLVADFATSSIPIHCQQLVEEVIQNYFEGIPSYEMTIAPLTGGNSNTSLVITVNSKRYVLRIKDRAASIDTLKGELYAMEEAAKIGIAPIVFYSTNDCRAMLMDYIEGDTASTAQTKEQKNCIQLAQALRKAHAIQKNPYFNEGINEATETVYSEISHHFKIKAQLDVAIELVRAYRAKLSKFDSKKVNIHGELNPRNIFITDKGVQLIDWEFTSWEDPFYDLSYLALFNDYTVKEEQLLLESYLHRSLTTTELERYDLNKKLNFSELCIFFHYFSLKCNPNLVELDDNPPSNTWSYYMTIFSERRDEMHPAQFFYDIARLSFKQASS